MPMNASNHDPMDAVELVAVWPTGLRHQFEERAAIMEFDGGATRADAEERALDDVLEAEARHALLALAALGSLAEGGEAGQVVSGANQGGTSAKVQSRHQSLPRSSAGFGATITK